VPKRPLTILNWHRQVLVATAIAGVVILAGVAFYFVHASTSRTEAQARLAAGTTPASPAAGPMPRAPVSGCATRPTAASVWPLATSRTGNG
jgi:hypothetical protein